jgi:hypothetical protein
MISLVERFPALDFRSKLNGYGVQDHVNSLTAWLVVGASVTMILLITVLSIVYNHNHSNVATTNGLSNTSDLKSTESDPNAPKLSDAALPGGGTANGDGTSSGAGAPVITLSATPATVNVGEHSKLSWSVTNNPKSCQASDDWSGEKAPSGEESTPALSSPKTYDFTLTCTNDAGSGSSSVSVGVMSTTTIGGPNAPEVTLAATPTTLYAGGNITLDWSSTNNPSKCEASDDWGNNVPKPTRGSESFGPLNAIQKNFFTLTCYNSAGSGSATILVNVTEPPAAQPIINFSSSPTSSAHIGDSVTFTWNVQNAILGCTASGDWSGSKPTTSTGLPPQTVGPLTRLGLKAYNFTLTCDNGGVTATKTISIDVLAIIPTVTLAATPTSITAPVTSSRLDWSFTNTPTSCTATGWSPSAVDVVVNPGSTTVTNLTANATSDKTYSYSLSCSNSGGTSALATATVIAKLPPPTVTLTAGAAALTSGQSTTITWSSSGATNCSTTGSWGVNPNKGLSGSQTTGALTSATGTTQYTYTLTCTNTGVSTTKSVVVSVNAAGVTIIAPVVTISIDKATILTNDLVGATITFTVTSNDPTPATCAYTGGTTGWRALTSNASGSYGTGQISTAGPLTFTLNCTNTAGSSGAKSVNLTVSAPAPAPTVTLSLSTSAVTVNTPVTVNWTSSDITAACTGNTTGTITTPLLFTGSKAVAANGTGSQTVTPTTTGVYNLTFSCTNTTGPSNTATATLTVSAAASYCSGATPCYGPLDLIDSTQTYGSGTTGFDTRVGTGGTKVNGTVVGKAGRGSGLQCWGYIGTQIIDLKAFGPTHNGSHYYVYNATNTTAGPVTTTPGTGATTIGKSGTTGAAYQTANNKVTGGGCGQDVDGILKGSVTPTAYGAKLNHANFGGVAPDEVLMKTYYLVPGTYDYTKP